jgi:hypothetical protein
MASQAATAKDGQFVLIFLLPDVCLTPDKDGIPIPYPITHSMDLSESCSPNVFFAGCPAFLHNQSYVDDVHGDEPGEGKGVISDTNDDISHSIDHSPNVFVNGKPIVRTGDLVWMNWKKPGLTAQEAQKLFDKLANDKNIPFDYPQDCCYARANEMCRQMQAAGVTCGKTWYYAAPGDSLQVTVPKTPVVPGGVVKWGYHVASTAEVEGQPMVFDPSLFKGPVTMDQWHASMTSSTKPIIKNTDSSPFYITPDGHAIYDDQNYSQTKASFEAHKKARDSLVQENGKK